MEKEKPKSKLQQSEQDLGSLVLTTNNLIKDLGNYAYCLNNDLIIIQRQFDKIRKVSSEKKREYNKVKNIRLKWNDQVSKIEKDYKSSLKTDLGGGAAGAGVGVGVAALGPTAAMSVATTFGVASTGTAISSLSGAAATNAALAWLGGGTLATGGSGIAGGTALLALAGPIGWTIAGVAIFGSGFFIWKNAKEKEALERIFLNICERDINTYNKAKSELNERITRIVAETELLNSAIVNIGDLGTDYSKMTKAQHFDLGKYFNTMSIASQLLVKPIDNLQPKVSHNDVDSYLSSNKVEEKYVVRKDLLVYFGNLLYGIKINENERILLTKSFKNNKEFLDKMKFNKEDISIELFTLINNILEFKYQYV